MRERYANMFAEERREIILTKLKNEGRISVKELSKELDISIDTIRRDLKKLEEDNLLKRTHGGAVLLSKVRRLPVNDKLRYGEGTIHQNAVAKKAAELIEEGDTVFIGGASIHYILLKYLPNNINFTVVTNSIIIAERLKPFVNIETYIVCGRVTSSDEIVDAVAIEFVRNLRIDKAFLTGGGIASPYGLSTSTPEGSVFQRVIGEISRKRICLANFDKIGVEFFVKTLNINDLDILITDWEAPEEELEKIKKYGIKVYIAKEKI